MIQRAWFLEGIYFAGFACKEKLKIKGLEKNIKVNSTYYQECVLCLIFKYEMSSLYSLYYQSIERH